MVRANLYSFQHGLCSFAREMHSRSGGLFLYNTGVFVGKDPMVLRAWVVRYLGAEGRPDTEMKNFVMIHTSPVGPKALNAFAGYRRVQYAEKADRLVYK